MAGRLLSVDASRESLVATCNRCGYRCVATTRDALRATTDRHRRDVHPTQAASAESKRRSRVTA